VVDNAQANRVTIQGSWTSSTYDSGFFDTNYIHDGNTAKGQKSVTFRPALPSASTYDVSLRWTSSGNRATNAPVTIVYSNSAAPVFLTVNQQTNGARWVKIGTYSFEPTAARVTIANSNTTGFVIVDAVQFTDTQIPVATGDRDADGLPDYWERWHFLSETAAQPGDDPDRDGRTNFQEYLTGTDPTDRKSRFDLRAQLDAVPHVVVLRWPSTTNRTYRIEVSEDLNEFHTHRQGIVGMPPENTETVLMTVGKQYFRVVTE
jgi:hypothetical protein